MNDIAFKNIQDLGFIDIAIGGDLGVVYQDSNSGEGKTNIIYGYEYVD